MQNLISLWTALSLNRRIVVGGAAVLTFLAVIAMSRIAMTPGMALLYAGLDGPAAGEVVQALEQRGVVYQVSGDTIRVDAAQRDVLRMTLAAEGLPTTGVSGYELLDGLSGFGTTSQMFDAAYWRAKEGELARTIVATPAVRAARVHIAQVPSQPFQRDRRPTASVSVTATAGGLTAAQAKALRHLVSAAVTGMQPEDVSVIDSVSGLVSFADENLTPMAGGDVRASELKRNIERLLAARVGPGHAIVEVSVEVETDRESVVERRFDPQGRVAISSETEERSNSATEASANVTVASNLPEGDAGQSGQGRSSGTETREKVNYEVSETQREILRTPGALSRISIAVLIDSQVITAADGSISREPRSEEELSVLRELVTSAAGLNVERGDILTLKSLSFQEVGSDSGLAETGLLHALGPIDTMNLLQIAVLAIVSLILGLFVVKPLLFARGRAELPGQSPLSLPGATSEKNARQTRTEVLTGEIDDDRPDFEMVAIGSDQAGSGASDPMMRLRRLIDERQSESVEILRGWMETDEEEKV